MHGGHQLAQKFSTRSFPPKLSRVTVLPSSVVTSKFGRGVAGVGDFAAPAFRKRHKLRAPASNRMEAQAGRRRYGASRYYFKRRHRMRARVHQIEWPCY